MDAAMRNKSTTFVRLLPLALLALLCALQFAQARFRQPSEEYQARRAKLMSAKDGPVVIFGYTGHEDPSEVAVFFQEPYFYYLSGHDEPGAALVLIPRRPVAKHSMGHVRFSIFLRAIRVRKNGRVRSWALMIPESPRRLVFTRSNPSPSCTRIL